jgi:hypothetical protein
MELIQNGTMFFIHRLIMVLTIKQSNPSDSH